MVIVSRINSAADSVFGSQRPVHGAALCLSPPISDKSIRFHVRFARPDCDYYVEFADMIINDRVRF